MVQHVYLPGDVGAALRRDRRLIYSLRAQRIDRLQIRGPASGEETGERRDDTEKNCHEQVGGQIVGRDIVKHGVEGPRDQHGKENSEDQSGGDLACALADDERENRQSIRSEGRTNADLPGALRDGVSHHPVETDRGEKQSAEPEDFEQGPG